MIHFWYTLDSRGEIADEDQSKQQRMEVSVCVGQHPSRECHHGDILELFGLPRQNRIISAALILCFARDWRQISQNKSHGRTLFFFFKDENG
jgi:hypothetical protein